MVQAPPTSVTTQREKKAARPPKKKFQKAGLYSDVYKTDEYVFRICSFRCKATFSYPPCLTLSSCLTISPRGQLLQLKKEKLEYIPGEHDYGLLPAPIHVGRSASSTAK